VIWSRIRYGISRGAIRAKRVKRGVCNGTIELPGEMCDPDFHKRAMDAIVDKHPGWTPSGYALVCTFEKDGETP
jgi:hypothetical protein